MYAAAERGALPPELKRLFTGWKRAPQAQVAVRGTGPGGHRGVFDPERGDDGIGTFALVRMLARQCNLPIIAAGGIMDGRGMVAAMTLGAVGVQMGTAFVLCPESSTNAAYWASRTCGSGVRRIDEG